MSHWFYITPEEYAEANKRGISNNLVYDRVYRMYWPKERALTELPNSWHVNKKWEKIREENGICLQTFKSRIYRGWDYERAATEPLVKNKKGQKYPEKYMIICQKNGIPWRTFRNRVLMGWSMKRASTESLWTRSQRGTLGARRLREREGDWAAQIFGKREQRNASNHS